MDYKLTINELLPNLNDYIKALNVNKYRGAELKSVTEDKISKYIEKQLKGITIQDKVFVTFKWFEQNQKRDKDNISSAKKFIFDALVKNKVLKNDGWANVEGFDDEFFIDEEQPRVEVFICVFDDDLPF